MGPTQLLPSLGTCIRSAVGLGISNKLVGGMLGCCTAWSAVHWSLLTYSCCLLQVDGKQEIAAGSEEELELRAASIHAVELLRQAVQSEQLAQAVHSPEQGHREGQANAGQQQQQQQERQLLSIHLDWWLWEEGERMRKEHPPHHRTWTIYY